MPEDIPDYASVNRSYWDDRAHEWVEMGERAWTSEPTWGMFGIPDAGLDLIPSDMTGMRAIELGCGTGYISGWMAKRGAAVVGIDNSAKQLETAQRLAAEHDVAIEFVHGIAEELPYPDESFDYAVSEYGAAIWSDPYVWLPEAHRVLKSGSSLVFLTNSALAVMCSPLDGSVADRTLHRPYFGMHRIDWTEVEVDPGGIDFHLTMTDWFALFKKTGFAVEDFYELRAPKPSDNVRFFVKDSWAYDFPAEQVWRIVKK